MESSQEKNKAQETPESPKPLQDNTEPEKNKPAVSDFFRTAAKAVLALISFVLFVIFVALIILYPANIGNILENINVTGIVNFLQEEGLIDEFVYFANNHMDIGTELSTSDVCAVLDNEAVTDEAGKILGNYLQAAADGDFTYYMTSEDAADVIKTLAADVNSFQFTDEMHTAIAASFYINNTLRENSLGNLSESAGIDVALLWVFFTIYPALITGTFFLLFIFNLFLIIKKPSAAICVTGIIITLAGLLYTVAGMAAGVFLNPLNGIVYGIISDILSSLTLPGIICLIIGVVITGFSFVARKLSAKGNSNTDDKKCSKIRMYAGIGGNAAMLIICSALMLVCISSMPGVRADWRGYRDSEEYALAAIPPTPTPAPTPTPILTLRDDILPHVKIDDIIPIGEFDWRVLDIQGENALVITNTVIEIGDYHNVHYATLWANSKIREYLNNDFLRNFSNDELEIITETRTVNNNNPWFSTKGGNDTTDKVFLLSLDDVILYFGDSGLIADRPGFDIINVDDEYNDARTATYANGNFASWWLRTPGRTEDGGYNAVIVDENGIINISGVALNEIHGIRPAMWLSLE